MDLAFFGDFDYFFLGGLRVTILQIEENRIIEKDAVLWDYRDVLAEGIKLEFSNILSIDKDLTFRWVKDSEE